MKARLITCMKCIPEEYRDPLRFSNIVVGSISCEDGHCVPE